jgi:hypothetical protein
MHQGLRQAESKLNDIASQYQDLPDSDDDQTDAPDAAQVC